MNAPNLLPHALAWVEEPDDWAHMLHVFTRHRFRNRLQSFRNSDELALFHRQVRELTGPLPLPFMAASPGMGQALKQSQMADAICVSKPLGFFKLLEALQKLGMFWTLTRLPPKE